MARKDKEIMLMQLGDYCSKHDCERNCPFGKMANEMNQLCPAFLRNPEAAQYVANFLKHRRTHKEVE